MKGLLMVVLLLPVAPADSYATVDYWFEDPGLLHMSYNLTLTETEATLHRQVIDEDRDGDVSPFEYESSRSALRVLINGTGADLATPAGRILVDGRTATYAKATALEDFGILGQQRGPVVIVLEIEWLFPVTPGETHELHLEPSDVSRSGFFTAPTRTATIVAPPGYVIARSGGLPLDAESTGTAILLPSGLSDEVSDLDVDFHRPPPTAKTPIPLMALLGIVMTLFWRRRL